MTPRVFVSRPAALGEAQEETYRWWIRCFRELGLLPVALARPAYADPPWLQLRTIVDRCDGMAALGFAQLEVHSALWRAGTAEAAPVCGAQATAWNQIEAGMAIARGLPLLVAADHGVGEGVFSSSVWGQGVFGLSIADDPTSSGAVREWARAVLGPSRRPGLTAQAAGGSGMGVPSQDMSSTNAVPAATRSRRATRFQWRRPMRK